MSESVSSVVAIAPVAHASYEMGAMLGLKGFCAAVLGGLGNGIGAVLGGLIIGVAERLAIGFAPTGYSGYKDLRNKTEIELLSK